MKNVVYVLKWYILDPSSYNLKDVDVYIFNSLEDAEMRLKEIAYGVYVDNEGDEVKFENWKLEMYDSYDYEIYSDLVN
jgi:hypothetical protein